MKGKNSFLLVSLFVIIVIVGVFAVPPAAGAESGVVRIAALYNLTGGMSSIDLPALKGAMLAAKIVNKGGGLPDGRKIDIVPVDTKTDAKSAVNEAEKAVKMDIAAGMGYGDSTYVLLAAPIFQSRGIPFVTSGATLPDLPGIIGNCLFMAAFGDDAQARAIADFARNRLMAGKIVVWTDSTMDFTKSLSLYFKDYFRKAGGQIIDEVFFKAGEKDFSGQIARLKALTPAPDAIFISAVPDEAGVTVKHIRQSGIDMPIISGDGFDTDLIVSVPGKELASDIYFATHIFRGEGSEKVKEFINKYNQEYGHVPESAFAALGFDTVMLIAEAICKAGSAEKGKLVEAIGSIKGFKGITGEISFKNPLRPPDKPVSIVRVRKGRYEAVETWKP